MHKQIKKAVKRGARTTVRTVYEETGARDMVRGARREASKIDRKLFGGKGLKKNIETLRRELKKNRRS